MNKTLASSLILGAFLASWGGAPSANAEVVPDPSTIVTNNFFTLGEPTTTKPTSGGYITLYSIDESTWEITPVYSTFIATRKSKLTTS